MAQLTKWLTYLTTTLSTLLNITHTDNNTDKIPLKTAVHCFDMDNIQEKYCNAMTLRCWWLWPILDTQIIQRVSKLKYSQLVSDGKFIFNIESPMNHTKSLWESIWISVLCMTRTRVVCQDLVQWVWVKVLSPTQNKICHFRDILFQIISWLSTKETKPDNKSNHHNTQEHKTDIQ